MIANSIFKASTRSQASWKTWGSVMVAAALLTGLYLASRYSFLLFHSLVELFSILVAFSVFTLAWNSRDRLDNNYLLFVGMAYLAIGFLDLMHVFAYKGMGIIPDHNGNSATQLWIGARYLESLSLLGGISFIAKRLNTALLLVFLISISASIVLMIFHWHVFPDCFVAVTGLTPFKIGSEYVISAVLLIAMRLLWVKRHEFERRVFRFLFFSILTTIAAELAFTFYVSVYGISNIVGHFLKLVSFYLVYRAIVVTGINKPFELIYRKLRSSEQNLKHERDYLRKTLQEIKVLSGLLPICSYCKKIRDDGGYWSQLETYINQHSMADFSHSICPDCELKTVEEMNQGRNSENELLSYGR